MSSFQDIYKKNKRLHHAYLLEGEKEIEFQNLVDFLENEFGFSIVGNPDFWLGDFGGFGVADSREIKDFQSKKPIAGDKKILIIKTDFMTREAQNALLKIFEEPTENTHFFLIMASAETLLPTLKSRLTIIKHLEALPPNQTFGGKASKCSVEKFLEANIAERFELIKVFLPKKKNALNSQSGEKKADKVGAILLLNYLEKNFYQIFQAGKKTATASPSPSLPPNPNLENIFPEIIKCRSYLNDRSPSVKMILEHLSQII